MINTDRKSCLKDGVMSYAATHEWSVRVCRSDEHPRKCSSRRTHLDCIPGIVCKRLVFPTGSAPGSQLVSDWLCNAWTLDGIWTAKRAILRNPDWATAAVGSQTNHGCSSLGRPSTSPLRTSKRKSNLHRKRLTASAAEEPPPLEPTSSPLGSVPMSPRVITSSANSTLGTPRAT